MYFKDCVYYENINSVFIQQKTVANEMHSIVMQEASDAHSKTADSDTVSNRHSFTSNTASQSTDRPSTKWI